MSRTYSNINDRKQKHSKVSSKQYLYLDSEPRDAILFFSDDSGMELFPDVSLMKREFRQRAYRMRNRY